MSEAPSVASPLKPRGQNMEKQGRRERMNGGARRLGTGEHATAEGTSRGNAIRQRTDRGGRASNHRATITSNIMGSEATSTDGAAITESGLEITGARPRDKRKARRSRTRMGYKQQVKPIFERLLGQLELALLGGMEEVVGIRTEMEWTTMECPAIVRLFVNKQREFARFVMDASSQDEAVGAVRKLHGAWVRRKTK